MPKVKKSSWFVLALDPFMSWAFFIMNLSLHFCVDSRQWLGKHNPPFIIYYYSIGPVPLMVYSGTEVLDIEAFIDRGLLGAQGSLSFSCSQCQESDEGFQGHFVFFWYFHGLSVKVMVVHGLVFMLSMALILYIRPACLWIEMFKRDRLYLKLQCMFMLW